MISKVCCDTLLAIWRLPDVSKTWSQLDSKPNSSVGTSLKWRFRWLIIIRRAATIRQPSKNAQSRRRLTNYNDVSACFGKQLSVFSENVCPNYKKRLKSSSTHELWRRFCMFWKTTFHFFRKCMSKVNCLNIDIDFKHVYYQQYVSFQTQTSYLDHAGGHVTLSYIPSTKSQNSWIISNNNNNQQ